MSQRVRVVVLVVAFFTSAGCRRAGCAWRAASTTDEQEVEEQDVARLRPAKRSPVTVPIAGHSLVVELTPDSPRFSPSENPYVTLVLRSSGPPLEVDFRSTPGGALDRPENILAAFRTTSGRVLPQASRRGDDYNGASGWQHANPELRRRLRLTSWATRLEPGHYDFHLETRVRARVDPAAPWQDVDVRVETPVDVVADDAGSLGRLVESLGTQVASAPYDDAREALTRLEAIRDPRVVPVFVQLATSHQSEFRGRALAALGPFDDARAVAALDRGIATTAADLDPSGFTNDSLREDSARLVRTSAVHALADSPHATAFSTLMTHRNDADAEIRLTVLHRLSRDPASANAAQIESFTNDADDTVRREAQRILAEYRH